jgi:cytochrome c biogenesis protein CcmG, thiol:disulfide interchange protein DsbE
VAVPVRRVLQAGAVLLLLALVGLFAKSLVDSHTSIATQVADGKHPAAPIFTLGTIGRGGDTTLSSFRGKVVVLNFWASWCDPCKDEAPALEELSQKYGSRLAVVGVDSQDTTADAAAFAARYHLTYPLVHAAGNEIYRRWGLSGFPETFILDRTLHVVHHFPGPVDAQAVEAEIGPLLGGAA